MSTKTYGIYRTIKDKHGTEYDYLTSDRIYLSKVKCQEDLNDLLKHMNPNVHKDYRIQELSLID